jgi:uncharacterized membrane protein YphA (DoxX/SURF4 family)
MSNPLRSKASHCLGLLLARVPLGVLFFLAGLMKIQQMGVNEFAEKSKGLLPPWLPQPLGMAYLHALPFVELTIGIMAILGLGGRIAGLLMSLILISILVATGVKADKGPLNTNFIVLGVALMLFFTGPGGISIDSLFCRRKRDGEAHGIPVK